MKTLPNKETNDLSPLVVSKPRIPLRGDPAEFFFQCYVPVTYKAIKIKNVL